MKVSLKVNHRVALGKIMPTTSDFKTIKTVIRILKKIVITEQDKQNLQISRNQQGVLVWDQNADGDGITVHLDKAESSLIKKILSKLDKSKKIDIESYQLFIIFMGDESDVRPVAK